MLGKPIKRLHIDLGKELDKRFVFDSLASIIKPESDQTVHFEYDEVQALTAVMISKIQDASEEHDFPMFKNLVTEYLQHWKAGQVVDAETEDEEEEEQKEDDDDEDDDTKAEKKDDEEDNEGNGRQDQSLDKHDEGSDDDFPRPPKPDDF